MKRPAVLELAEIRGIGLPALSKLPVLPFRASLKARFAWGRISREEFIELKQMLLQQQTVSSKKDYNGKIQSLRGKTGVKS
jgi:hypothetical protein